MTKVHMVDKVGYPICNVWIFKKTTKDWKKVTCFSCQQIGIKEGKLKDG